MKRINLQLFAVLNTGTSIVDYLKSQGKDSSYSARKDLAASLGISNYSGTAEQNSAMLKALKNGGGTSAPSNPTNTNVAGSAINGVEKSTIDKMNSIYQKSDQVTNAQAEADKYLANLKQMSSATDIVDQSTWDAINKPFQSSTAYQDAMNYTNQLLQQLSSGKTSYTDQIKDLMEQIRGRDPFNYDVDSDPLFQQALASAMGSGKAAMQNTIGQAAALTGGYGSTYATSAGNQAYNAYIQDAYNNLPEYYQMALEAYQTEGQEMYNQLAMLNEADATEFQRMYDSWNANFNNAQQMYQKEYGEWQDGITNAFNSANLQLQEYGQLYDQAYNAYSAVQNNANTLYAQEYQKWADEVANAMSYASLANSDYWNTQKLAQDQAQFEAGLNAKADSASGDSGFKEPSETQMKRALEAYNTGGEDALYQYMDSLPSDIDVKKIDKYIYGDEEEEVKGYGMLPLEQRKFTKVEDTWNGLWGVDNNDIVEDQYGNQYRIDELPESIQKSLTKLKKGETYTAK